MKEQRNEQGKMTVTGCHFALANGLCKGLGQAPLLTSKGCESLLANTQPRAENRKPKTQTARDVSVLLDFRVYSGHRTGHKCRGQVPSRRRNWQDSTRINNFIRAKAHTAVTDTHMSVQTHTHTGLTGLGEEPRAAAKLNCEVH